MPYEGQYSFFPQDIRSTAVFLRDLRVSFSEQYTGDLGARGRALAALKKGAESIMLTYNGGQDAECEAVIKIIDGLQSTTEFAGVDKIIEAQGGALIKTVIGGSYLRQCFDNFHGELDIGKTLRYAEEEEEGSMVAILPGVECGYGNAYDFFPQDIRSAAVFLRDLRVSFSEQYTGDLGARGRALAALKKGAESIMLTYNGGQDAECEAVIKIIDGLQSTTEFAGVDKIIEAQGGALIKTVIGGSYLRQCFDNFHGELDDAHARTFVEVIPASVECREGILEVTSASVGGEGGITAGGLMPPDVPAE